MPNADEIAYWNETAGDRWAELQAQLDRAFEPLTAAGLAAAATASGETVLDVGCGCGETVIGLSRATGGSGMVTGVDVSEPMLAVAQRRTSALGLTNVRFTRADAATQPFAAECDLVFSRFGVMFFDDPVAAFRNIRGALRSRGRCVFVCWRELKANPWFTVPIGAVRPHVPQQPKLDPLAPGPLAFADPDRVRDILGGAGFSDIAIEPFDALLPFGDRAAASNVVSKVGPTSRLLGGADQQEASAAMRALDAALATHEIGAEVSLGAGVWIVRATNS